MLSSSVPAIKLVLTPLVAVVKALWIRTPNRSKMPRYAIRCQDSTGKFSSSRVSHRKNDRRYFTKLKKAIVGSSRSKNIMICLVHRTKLFRTDRV